MTPIEILSKINEEIHRIELTLPENGRRLEVLEIIVSKEYFDILLQDEVFVETSFTGKQNLGGIPVTLGDKFKIIYTQGDKKRRPWARRKVEWQNLENVSLKQESHVD
jgi:hypothetical protein